MTLAYSSGYLEKAPSYLLEQIELLEDGQKSAFNGLSEGQITSSPMISIVTNQEHLQM